MGGCGLRGGGLSGGGLRGGEGGDVVMVVVVVSWRNLLLHGEGCCGRGCGGEDALGLSEDCNVLEEKASRRGE